MNVVVVLVIVIGMIGNASDHDTHSMTFRRRNGILIIVFGHVQIVLLSLSRSRFSTEVCLTASLIDGFFVAE
jgi:hypothetical protein